LNKFITKIFPLSIVVILMATMLFSCENDVQGISKLTQIDSMPAMTVKNIKVKQSERGMITLELTAPLLRAYEGKDPYTEFPNGVHITFFDSLVRPKSELTAGYGVSYDSRRVMEARNNVVIRNFNKREQLNTERLTWDENKKKLFTEEFVKITQVDKIIFGKGMESDEVFDNWVIHNVSGTIYVVDKK